MGLLITLIAIICLYIVIAITLVLTGNQSEMIGSRENGLQFDELKMEDSELPACELYKCRDGEKLPYRYYPSDSDNVLILLHGSGLHSRYLYTLAKNISTEKIAKVYTPDLRGNGINPTKRGDIKYINQLEDDIADLIKWIQKRHPKSNIILGGHSLGGVG